MCKSTSAYTHALNDIKLVEVERDIVCIERDIAVAAFKKLREACVKAYQLFDDDHECKAMKILSNALSTL